MTLLTMHELRRRRVAGGRGQDALRPIRISSESRDWPVPTSCEAARPASPRDRFARRAPRAGLSLVEVLVSCAIMVFGLLSLAALIPIGLFQAAQAARADSASAVGRAAWRSIKVNDLLRDRVSYFDASGNYLTVGRYVYVDTANDAGARGYMPFPVARRTETATTGDAYAGAYVIDPYGLAGRNGTTNSVGSRQEAMATFPPGLDPAVGTGLPRVTLTNRFPIGTPFADLNTVAKAYLGDNARRLVTSTDDASYDYAPVKGDLARPVRVVSDSSASGALGAGTFMQSEGHYSWMITVSPVFGEPSPQVATSMDDDLPVKLFNVSVVVFYRRPIPPAAGDTPAYYPSEQESRAEVDLGSTTVSDVYGRSIQLRWDGITNLDSIPRLRAKDWIMLYGRVADNTADALDEATPTSLGDANVTLATSADGAQYFPIPRATPATGGSSPANALYVPGATNPTLRSGVFQASVLKAKWCQIVAADPAEVATAGGGCTQRLSLKATDFDLISGVRTQSASVTVAPQYGFNRPGFYAATCAGVVGVFEKTIRLE